MTKITDSNPSGNHIAQLTDQLKKTLLAPRLGQTKSGYIIYWCDKEPNFGLRVTVSGGRSWIIQCYDKNKKLVRRTIKIDGETDALRINIKSAIREKDIVYGLLRHGQDEVRDKKIERKAKAVFNKIESDTLDKVLHDYVKKKRKNGKEKLPLKERTKSDYIAMLKAGGFTASGKPKADGELYPLANKPITTITANDIRTLYSELQKRGKGTDRRANYAMQVLRAVLNWAGVKITDNPLGKEVAGRDKIVVSGSKQKANPIPVEFLGKWWHEATKASMDSNGIDSADYLRFKLLTGCRGCEIKGDAFGNEPIHVKDVNLKEARLVLQNTKNRKEHTLHLSTQALEIVKKASKGKKPNDILFNVKYPSRRLKAINATTGLKENAHSEHDLRDTFASIADDLVSQYTLKKMMNHSSSEDVTGGYVGKGKIQLRSAWQVVSDFIEEQENVYIQSNLTASNDHIISERGIS